VDAILNFSLFGNFTYISFKLLVIGVLISIQLAFAINQDTSNSFQGKSYFLGQINENIRSSF
jgi:hypothetical protein